MLVSHWPKVRSFTKLVSSDQASLLHSSEDGCCMLCCQVVALHQRGSTHTWPALDGFKQSFDIAFVGRLANTINYFHRKLSPLLSIVDGLKYMNLAHNDFVIATFRCSK